MDFTLRENESLAEHTTLGVGGRADYFAEVKTEVELLAALRFALAQTATPPLILGGGSNVICRDEGYRGLVIKMSLRGIQYEKKADRTLVTAAAGEPWDEFVNETVEQGLAGMENLSGIPGTVGASPIQNINAYGAIVGNSIYSVSVLDRNTLERKELSNADCAFGYRDSVFKHTIGKDLIVTAVTFVLSESPDQANLSYRSSSQSIANYLSDHGITDPTPADVRQAVLFARGNIGMLEGQFRSAGSCFKNVIVDQQTFERLHAQIVSDFSEQDKKFSPWYWNLPDGTVKIAAAFLLECSPYNKTTYGEKRINQVGLSPKHSLSVVTEPGATARDVENFLSLVIDYMQDTFSIDLEREVLTV